MNERITPTALEDLRRHLVGKPVTYNGKQVGVVTEATTGYDGVYFTAKVDDPKLSRWLQAADIKVDF